MFFRVLLLVAFVIGGLGYLGGETSKPRVTGAVSEPQDRVADTVKKFGVAKSDIERRLSAVAVPNYMIKPGQKPERLSRSQKREYAIYAVFFANDPVMPKIAACESSLRHALPNGNVHVSEDGEDVGAFQLRLKVHAPELARHGLDPARFEDNVAYATHIFRRDGLRHWNSSRTCWENIKLT